MKMILFQKFYFNQNQESVAIKTKQKSENQWKFVVKKSIKFLKRKVKYQNNYLLKGEKLEDEKQFFRYYFQKTADELEIPIERFFLPNSKLRKIQKQENEI